MEICCIKGILVTGSDAGAQAVVTGIVIELTMVFTNYNWNKLRN